MSLTADPTPRQSRRSRKLSRNGRDGILSSDRLLRNLDPSKLKAQPTS